MDKVLDFIKGPHRNLWLESDTIKVYVRKASRKDPDTGLYVHCLDVANIEVQMAQGDGVFTKWLEDTLTLVKARPEFDGIYIENVLTERFANFFRRTGAIEDTRNSPPSFFIPAKPRICKSLKQNSTGTEL